MAVTTVDLDPVEQAIRLRLLLTRSATGSPTLAERLSGGLHVGSPPDNADYPYGALRLLNIRPYPIDAPMFVGDVELQLFFRPRSEARALRQATDVATEALDNWKDLTVGITRVRVRDADVLPPFSEHADHEVITSRATFSIVLFPVPST